MKIAIITAILSLGALAKPSHIASEGNGTPVGGYGTPVDTPDRVDIELERAAGQLAAVVEQDRVRADLSFQLGRLDVVLTTLENGR